MNLHNIIIKGLEANIWMLVYGGNGTAIDNGMAHLYRIPRGTPPPIVDGLGWQAERRMYWGPFNTVPAWNAEQALTPLCGRLRSRSRLPYLMWAYEAPWQPVTKCPNCLAIDDGMFQGEAVRNDPWTTMPWQDRRTTLDPLTGV